MKLSVVSAFALLVLVAMATAKKLPPKVAEKKVGRTLRLCGGAFLSTWQLACCMKNDCTRKRRSIDPADIVSIIKPNNEAVISEKFANQFLKMGINLKRKRRNVQQQDNALEECCNEKCTLEEVSEYPC